MSITEHATLADRIRELRKHFGLTQQELANKLGVPRGRVSNWEGGGGMGKASVQRLREVFGVTRGWLFEGEGSLPANQDKRADMVMFSGSGDGHLVDASAATGKIAEFFRTHMGPTCEAWQITTDLLDATAAKPGAYVVIEVGREPEPRAVVLALVREGPGMPVPVFRVWVGGKLITASATPSDAPVIVVDNDRVTLTAAVLVSPAAMALNWGLTVWQALPIGTAAAATTPLEMISTELLTPQVRVGGLLDLAMVGYRKRDCPTEIHRAFVRVADRNTVHMESVPAAPQKVQSEPINLKVGIRLPQDMAPGRYEYHSTYYTVCKDNVFTLHRPPVAFEVVKN